MSSRRNKAKGSAKSRAEGRVVAFADDDLPPTPVKPFAEHLRAFAITPRGLGRCNLDPPVRLYSVSKFRDELEVDEDTHLGDMCIDPNTRLLTLVNQSPSLRTFFVTLQPTATGPSITRVMSLPPATVAVVSKAATDIVHSHISDTPVLPLNIHPPLPPSTPPFLRAAAGTGTTPSAKAGGRAKRQIVVGCVLPRLFTTATADPAAAAADGAPAATAARNWLQVSQGFGGRLTHQHPETFYAADFECPRGTALVAPFDCEVVAACDDVADGPAVNGDVHGSCCSARAAAAVAGASNAAAGGSKKKKGARGEEGDFINNPSDVRRLFAWNSITLRVDARDLQWVAVELDPVPASAGAAGPVVESDDDDDDDDDDVPAYAKAFMKGKGAAGKTAKGGKTAGKGGAGAKGGAPAAPKASPFGPLPPQPVAVPATTLSWPARSAAEAPAVPVAAKAVGSKGFGAARREEQGSPFSFAFDEDDGDDVPAGAVPNAVQSAPPTASFPAPACEYDAYIEFVHIRCGSIPDELRSASLSGPVRIPAGAVVATSGQSGFCPSPHVHVEVLIRPRALPRAPAIPIPFFFSRESVDASAPAEKAPGPAVEPSPPGVTEVLTVMPGAWYSPRA